MGWDRAACGHISVASWKFPSIEPSLKMLGFGLGMEMNNGPAAGSRELLPVPCVTARLAP